MPRNIRLSAIYAILAVFEQYFTALGSVFKAVVTYAPILLGLSRESSQHITKTKPLKKHMIFGYSYSFGVLVQYFTAS